jgi:putative heme-binding domain-containing protein
MGDIGTAVGPDLTSLANRFTGKEVLESILFPSHIISDQYRTQRLLTLDGKIINGIVTENADGSYLVRDSNLVEHVVAEQDIDQIQSSKTSLMPSGLIDTITAAEIRDLMTFLGFVPEQPAQQVADSEAAAPLSR